MASFSGNNDDEYPNDYVPGDLTRRGILSDNKKSKTDLDASQWQVGTNQIYRPVSKSIPQVPSGVYRIGEDNMGLYLQFQHVITDNIVELPGTSNESVLTGMKKFWNSRDSYDKFGLIYKRGVLLYGPPGAGKSVSLQLLMRHLISLDGVVLICDIPDRLERMLTKFRQAEADRALIVIMEDIDEIIENHGEHSILSMLDGENQICNVVYLATTNYPDKLGARIINRPSRFDERIIVGMPSEHARRSYLMNIAQSHMSETEMDKWVADTKNFSIAHLRELVAAVFCLEQPYEEVLTRLRSLFKKPKYEEGFRDNSKAGFLVE